MKHLVHFLLLSILTVSCRSTRTNSQSDLLASSGQINSVNAPNSKTKSTVLVNGAQFDAQQNLIVISVTYAGISDELHKFKLRLEGCKNVVPRQCSATLVDITIDKDSSDQTHDIFFTLNEAGLDKSEYSDAVLVIKGKENTEATVKLPKMR